MEGRAGPDVFGDQIGVLTHAIAGALDLNDDSVVEQPIEQRGGDDGIAEDVAPFGEAAVRGEDHRTLFIAGVDQLEEQIATAWGDRQVADFVDDKQRTAAQEADFLAQRALCQRRREDASAGRSKNASRGLPSIALPNWLSCLIDVSLLSRPDLGTDGRGAQRRGWEERSHAHPGLDPGEHGEHRTFPAASTVAD